MTDHDDATRRWLGATWPFVRVALQDTA